MVLQRRAPRFALWGSGREQSTVLGTPCMRRMSSLCAMLDEGADEVIVWKEGLSESE